MSLSLPLTYYTCSWGAYSNNAYDVYMGLCAHFNIAATRGFSTAHRALVRHIFILTHTAQCTHKFHRRAQVCHSMRAWCTRFMRLHPHFGRIRARWLNALGTREQWDEYCDFLCVCWLVGRVTIKLNSTIAPHGSHWVNRI